MNRAARDIAAPERRAQGFSAHSVRLAWILAVAYLLTIVYASVQPFQGWRMPPEDIQRFLTAPWPRYITLEDILVNVVAYMPLGFLLSIGCGARYGAGLGVLAAAFFAAGASLAMEALQMFLPSRIASNVDLITNGLGALIGAMAAPLFAPSRLLGRGLHAWRHRVFKEGMVADVGFVIVCLWIPAQLHPTTQLFGTGAMRAILDLPAYFAHTPQLILWKEALVVFFNLVGLGMMLAALMQPAARPMLIPAVVIGTGFVFKTAAALGRGANPLVWLTPGVSFGLLAGWLALYALRRLPRRAQLVLAALCIMIATAAINLNPDNPYQNVPPQLLAGGPSHYLSFSGIARAVSELWPLLAVGYLLWVLFERKTRDPL